MPIDLNIGGDPTVVVIYGGMGLGKTLALLRTAPTATVCTPKRGALAARVVYLGGVGPREVEVKTFDDVVRVLRALRSTTVVVTDCSVIAERTLVQIEAKTSGWKKWTALNGKIGTIREVALENRLTVLMDFHEVEPDTIEVEGDDGRKETKVIEAGGAGMPSKKTRVSMPNVAELVARVTPSTMAPPLWHATMSANPQERATWETKDRYAVLLVQPMPLNVREWFVQARTLGHNIAIPPRPPGLEWLDDAAEWVATGLAAGNIVTAAHAAPLLRKMMPTAPEALLAWALQDGYARFRFRTTENPYLSLFGKPASASPASTVQAQPQQAGTPPRA